MRIVLLLALIATSCTTTRHAQETTGGKTATGYVLASRPTQTANIAAPTIKKQNPSKYYCKASRKRSRQMGNITLYNY